MQLDSAPAWDLTEEYPSITSEKFTTTEKEVLTYIKELTALTAKAKSIPLENIENKLIVEILSISEKAQILLYDLHTYVNCSSSIDVADESLQAKSSEMSILATQLQDSLTWAQLYVIQIPDQKFEEIFSSHEIKNQKFTWLEERRTRDQALSETEESLLTGMGQSGFHAWAELYSQISGTMKVQVSINNKSEEFGLAHASALVRGGDPKVRKAAWTGIQNAWRTHQESAASILNALAGWRLEQNKRRSHVKPVHFLDAALLNNRIERKTLDAMLSAIKNNLPALREGLQLMAKTHKTEKLNPWDLLAPSPATGNDDSSTSFSDAIGLIKKSFRQVSPSMSEFVDIMVSQKRLEGRVLKTKANGGYCATFKKSRMPVVFQTYMGSSRDLFTLAHELGHAYHSFVMKDLSFSESGFPSTLAETASIFAETLLSEDLIKNSSTHEEKFKYAFNNIEQITSLLINIPARFEFEKSFYEKRSERTLSAKELCELTDQAWSKWYGDNLSENDKMYWASKLHFSMSYASFYNFPYTFGYLFALSIYARKDELGNQFHQKYVDLLKDTGRMRAEELIKKHLGEDIGQEKFWQKAIDISLKQIQAFKDLSRSSYRSD